MTQNTVTIGKNSRPKQQKCSVKTILQTNMDGDNDCKILIEIREMTNAENLVRMRYMSFFI